MVQTKVKGPCSEAKLESKAIRKQTHR